MRDNALPTSCSSIQNCAITLQGLCFPRELQSQAPGWAAPWADVAMGNQEHGCSGRTWSVCASCGFNCTPGSHNPSCNKAAHGFTKHVCVIKQAVLVTQQLAEETPLLLLLGAPNMLQEMALSEGHQLDHNSLLQRNRFRLARVDWRHFDLFINLSSLAERCPQSSPVALALELPMHTLPIFLPSSGAPAGHSRALAATAGGTRAQVCPGPAPLQFLEPALGANKASCSGAKGAALPSGCRGEHMGPFSWEHIKLSAVLVISSLVFLPLLGDTTLAAAPTTACAPVSSNKQPCSVPRGERAPGSSIQK